MGSIRHLATQQVRHLEVDHVVGRAASCALHVPELYVSSRHASLRWTGDGWEVRDLGSLNGTYLDGARIAAGAQQPLKAGAQIAFGRPEQTWEVVDTGAPVIMAVPLDGGEPVLAEQELVAIPSAEEPRATLYRERDGGWALEEPLRITPIADQQLFCVEGRSWRFCCPKDVHPTAMAAVIDLDVQDLTLTFRLSGGVEVVRLHAAGGDRRFDLGTRVHHGLLLALARRRLADADHGVPESSCGWVHQEELCREPGGASQLNVDVFRARRQFARLGVGDAAKVIERRPRSRQLRLGTGRLKIVLS